VYSYDWKILAGFIPVYLASVGQHHPTLYWTLSERLSIGSAGNLLAIHHRKPPRVLELIQHINIVTVPRPDFDMHTRDQRSCNMYA
jgi:hypothetical protein